MERMYFNQDTLFIKDPNEKIQKAVNDLLRGIKINQSTGSITLNAETAPKRFSELKEAFLSESEYHQAALDGNDMKTNKKVRMDTNFAQKFHAKSVNEFLEVKNLWLNFWEKQHNIKLVDLNFAIELLANNEFPLDLLEMTYPLFLFYIHMFFIVIGPPIRSLANDQRNNDRNIAELLKKAKRIFEEFATSGSLRKYAQRNATRQVPSVAWYCLENWMKESGNEQLMKIAFGGKKNLRTPFKIFFNTIFRASISQLNTHLTMFEV
ncbi:hypothetical protein PtA15_17A23 [Puccinia triticina]|uniref:Uncharacterized protein n=1 Tax=Puccinia triticina TaxID=208348 RepID=A0ABY7D797_9BASI|nr:uncharacterized protein PtA15_17A23 [Puccinia triticina]WAQ92542.1 hypothetical protein PtA15_17A23 [Puccinia triticina]